MPLTHSTQIPTAARGKVRALVKSHGAWADFLIGSGKLSASITNAELIRFALGHKDLTAKIEAVLGMAPAPTFRTKVRVKTDAKHARTTWQLQQLLMIAERHFFVSARN